MIIRIRRKFLAILVLLYPILLQAQSPELAEADFFDDAPLILTASRMSKPLNESPASVTVIDRQMIASSGSRELADIFRLVPGFIVGNLNGNTPVITYQGLGSSFARRLQVLVDGRSVFIPSFGGVSWTNLPLLIEDIERVEVIRGPNAATYGSNAFLATINIITRHAAEDIGARYSITTSDNANPDIGDAYLRLGYHLGNVDWRLSAGTLNDEGFSNINDSRQTNKFNFRLDYLANNQQFWTFQAGSSNSEKGLGETDDPTDIARDKEASNSYVNINWEQVRSDSSTNVRLAFTEQKVIDNFITEPFTFGIIPEITTSIDFDRVSNRTDLEIVQNEEINERLRLVYGLNLRRDNVKSLFLTNDNEYHVIDTSRLFTGVEWRIDENWLLDVGTTLEDSTFIDAAYSPRFSILRKLSQNHMLRFVASRARRNPILFELEGLTIYTANNESGVTFNDLLSSLPADIIPDFDVKVSEGDPNILPEDLVSYEIGLRSQIIDQALTTDIKIFTYTISDFINGTRFYEVPVDSTTGEPVQIFSDFGFVVKGQSVANDEEDIRVNGFEFSLDISPSHNLDIKSGFSVVHVDTVDSRIEDSFPDSTAFIASSYKWANNHSLSANYYYIDRMEWLGNGDPTSSINKLDVRYAYLLDRDSETRIELIGQNLLEDYPDYYRENINEKVIFVRISGGF